MAKQEAKQDDDKAPRFHVTAQYVKDLSFENPRAPQSLMAREGKPSIDINIEINGRKAREDLQEVTLHITAKASAEGETLFLVDLSYAGLFTILNIPEERLEQLLMVDCPFILFPFARRVIADATRDGGFPPLMLEPVDFFAMYRRKVEQNAAETVN